MAQAQQSRRQLCVCVGGGGSVTHCPPAAPGGRRLYPGVPHLQVKFKQGVDAGQ